MTKRFFCASILTLAAMCDACGGGVLTVDHCSSDAACPSDYPGVCERWACTEETGTDPRSGVPGCFVIPMKDGDSCDNGNPECTGHCKANACAVDVMPLPASCSATTDGGAP